MENSLPVDNQLGTFSKQRTPLKNTNRESIGDPDIDLEELEDRLAALQETVDELIDAKKVLSQFKIYLTTFF